MPLQRTSVVLGFVIAVLLLPQPGWGQSPASQAKLLNPVLRLGIDKVLESRSRESFESVFTALMDAHLIQEAELLALALVNAQEPTALAELARVLHRSGHPRCKPVTEAALQRLLEEMAKNPGYWGVRFVFSLLAQAGATCEQLSRVLDASIKRELPDPWDLLKFCTHLLDSGDSSCAQGFLNKITPIVVSRITRKEEAEGGDYRAEWAIELTHIRVRLGMDKEALEAAAYVPMACDAHGCEAEGYRPPKSYVAEALVLKGKIKDACQMCGGCGRCDRYVAQALAGGGAYKEAEAAARGMESLDCRTLAYMALAKAYVRAGKCDEARKAIDVVLKAIPELTPDEDIDPGTMVSQGVAAERVHATYIECNMPLPKEHQAKLPFGAAQIVSAEICAKRSLDDMQECLRRSSSERARGILVPPVVSGLLKSGRVQTAMEISANFATGSELAFALVAIGAHLHRTGTDLPAISLPMFERIRTR